MTRVGSQRHREKILLQGCILLVISTDLYYNVLIKTDVSPSTSVLPVIIIPPLQSFILLSPNTK